MQEVTRSPTELATWLACRRASALEAGRRVGRVAGPTGIDPTRDLLAERGRRHEARYVESLRERGIAVVDLRGRDVEATNAAMRDGAEAIVQATLATQARRAVKTGFGWSGVADVLVRVETPSELAAWSYEVHDTKLARETKVGTIVQLAMYSEMLGALQGRMPERFWVVPPGEPIVAQPWRVKDCAAYVRAARRRFESDVARELEERLRAEPEPCAHCDVCKWWKDCDDARREVDHLSFVAGISLVQRTELRRQGVSTTTVLAATAELPEAPKRGHADSYRALHRQAAILVRGRAAGEPVHEMLAVDERFGLGLLPAPSAGDLFLDLEADPFVEPGGREYLFGRSWIEGDRDAYAAEWALDAGAEALAFERTMDEILRRRAVDPGMHVYHFGGYEKAALQRMAGRHATRASELDELLRAGVLVDLHRVVRRTMVASVERYSLKELERFCGYARALPLVDARRAMRGIERALELGEVEAIDDAVRGELEAYNRDDCVSTRWLRDWLEDLRAQVERERGEALPRPVPESGEPPDHVAEVDAEVAAVQASLREGIADLVAPSDEERPRWTLAHLLEFHRREHNATWWEYFRLRELDEHERLRERDAIAGLVPVGAPETVKQSWRLRYRFAPQETALQPGDKLYDEDGQRCGQVERIDRVACELDVKIGKKSWDGVHRPWVFTWDQFRPQPKPQALLRFGASLGRGADDPTFAAARALLFRELPRLTADVPWTVPGESGQEQAVRVVLGLQRSVLAVQGPPGTGKTHTGAAMIVALVKAGKRVGVTGMSHAVIRNLLDKVLELDADVVVGARVRQADMVDGLIRETYDPEMPRQWLRSGEVQVVGGTTWMWAAEEFAQSVDVLFVDEAGQLALADVLAVAGATQSLVLLGDPQQLEQPKKAKHPEGTDVSALGWVIGERATIEAERGIFLEETWRLPPGICGVTSELFYDGRLRGKVGTERRRLIEAGEFDGEGVWFVPVEHEGCSVVSLEEVEVIRGIVGRLLDGGRWMDMDGVVARLGPRDVLVIAPYNAQVAVLGEALGPMGVRVGTVDKFQGQEAEVVIYSMTSSSVADAPRGMGFLFDQHRFNVATSRARVTCVIVGNSSLWTADCARAKDVRLVERLLPVRRTLSPTSDSGRAVESRTRGRKLPDRDPEQRRSVDRALEESAPRFHQAQPFAQLQAEQGLDRHGRR